MFDIHAFRRHGCLRFAAPPSLRQMLLLFSPGFEYADDAMPLFDSRHFSAMIHA